MYLQDSGLIDCGVRGEGGLGTWVLAGMPGNTGLIGQGRVGRRG